MAAGTDAELLRRAAAHVIVDDVDVPTLSEARAHHVFRVLRVRDDALVTVTDGRGRWRPCRARGGSVVPDGHVREIPESAPPVELYVAVPKQDRPEWLVQKATELGVDRIVLLHAERSVVRWDARRAARQLDRLRTTAAEAAMQSRRVRVPAVEGPCPAGELLGAVPGLVVAEPGGRPLRAGDHRVAIGPEGGWSDAELEAARVGPEPAEQVGLGPHVLRVETAALAACALLAARTGS